VTLETEQNQPATKDEAAEQCRPESEDASRVSPFVALLGAVGFLTRCPLPRRITESDPRTLRQSVAYFPLVGALVGCITAGVAAGFDFLWPAWLAVLLALAVEARLTGAFHEDAVADFFDGFGGGWTRDDVLRILKDSRIGSYGVVALTLAILLRASCMVLLIERFGREQWYVWGVALVTSAAIGRFAIVITMAIVPPAQNRESLSRDIGSRPSLGQLLLAFFWVLPLTVAFAILQPISAVCALLLLILSILYFSHYVRKRIGGMTGDCLGCICYISQLVVLLAANIDTTWWQ
jgi:adenosylcobinamide-GDP ribazoletransferase